MQQHRRMDLCKHKQTGIDCCSTCCHIAECKGLSVSGNQNLAVMHRRTASTADDPVDAAAEEQPVVAKPKANRNQKKEPKPGCCSLPPSSPEQQHQQSNILCSRISAQEALKQPCLTLVKCAAC